MTWDMRDMTLVMEDVVAKAPLSKLSTSLWMFPKLEEEEEVRARS